jgi:hypothetical protein
MVVQIQAVRDLVTGFELFGRERLVAVMASWNFVDRNRRFGEKWRAWEF